MSVLFVDLVGFTALSASRDPEDVRELLSDYFEVARAVVVRYGGTIEKFIGDAVMSVWGVPAANEDDAERAVRAALDLVADVGRLGEERGVPSLAARAGVLTGEAAVTLGAEGQGMVAGDVVNTASRIQSAAEPGWVLVGEASHAAARDAIAFEDAGDLDLKGKDEAVHAWRALRVVAQRKGAGRSDRLEPPFVGREADLRVLVDALHATTQEQRARLVSITGIPGIGKSRLGWEFLKYVDGLAGTVYWHHGRSPSYGEGVSFWALGEMVRERCGIAEGEDARSSRSKLAATLEDYIADADERRWVEPRLAHLLALAEAPLGDRQELFSAWRTFFERVADRGTAVMLFEDLQWADAGLIDFIESIVEWSRQRPILVVTLSRPELSERRSTWGAGARSFTAIHLEPLPDDDIAELVRGLVPDLPTDALGQVVHRAEGIPLYAVETVRALLDKGVILEQDGAYALVGEIHGLDVPGSLQALIASRLDSLSPEERALVQDAAILGTTFPLPLLTTVSQADPDVLATRLRSLVRKEVLSVERDPRSPERGQYGFVQSMIREVAYSTLSKKDRRAKHLAVAHELEGVGDEEVAGLVASHYMDAYRASSPGPESKAVAARARDGLSQACARALSLGSTEQALAFAVQALGITTHGPERTALLEQAGEASLLVAGFEQALVYYEEAVAFHEAASDPVAAGRVSCRLARALAGLGRGREAIERAERALAAIEGVDGGDDVRVKLGSMISAGYRLTGAPARALEVVETVLPIAERLGDRELLREAIGARGGALFDLGRRFESAALTRAGKELAATGSVREQAQAVLYESILLHDDDPRASVRAATEAAALYRRAGDRAVEIAAILNSAEWALYLGDWDCARETLDALSSRTELSEIHAAGRTCCLALLDGLTGDFEASDERFAEVDARMKDTSSVAVAHTLRHMRAMAGLAAGRLERSLADTGEILEVNPAGMNSAAPWNIRARAALWSKDVDSLESAIDGMAQLHGKWMNAVRATAAAGLRGIRGDPAGASDAYCAVAETWRSLDCPLDFALCGIDAALVLDEDHRPHDLLEEARAVLSRICAAPFLSRLPAERVADVLGGS